MEISRWNKLCYFTITRLFPAWQNQWHHNQKYHGASNNGEQSHFVSILLAQTMVKNLCNKLYDYACIPNIKNKSLVNKRRFFTHALTYILRCSVIHNLFSLFGILYNYIDEFLNKGEFCINRTWINGNSV